MPTDVAAPTEAPPLAVDIDGTLTDDYRRVDPRVFPVLRAWPAPVVVATGKAFPYPVALCEFVGIEPNVIAENGGVALAGRSGPIFFEGNPEAVTALVDDLQDQGYELGWGDADLINRWRETEVAVSREVSLAELKEIAADHGLVVIDSGYAYHVTAPDVSKGDALHRLAGELDLAAEDFVAVGDSENDAPMFHEVDRGVAVANADDVALEAADHVTDASYADGFLAAVNWLTARES